MRFASRSGAVKPVFLPEAEVPAPYHDPVPAGHQSVLLPFPFRALGLMVWEKDIGHLHQKAYSSSLFLSQLQPCGHSASLGAHFLDRTEHAPDCTPPSAC